MNARREAKYRAAEVNILKAKITRFTKIGFLGLMSFTVAFSTFLYYGGYTEKSSQLASDPKFIEKLQSVITYGSNAMYKFMKTGKTLDTEKDFIRPVKIEIPFE